MAKEAFGQPVRYGDLICLRHKDSSQFVVSKNECSKTNQIGYKVQIKKEFSRNMIFSITSRYKSLSIGDPVQFGDEIRILHNRSKNNLSVSLLNFEKTHIQNEQYQNPYLVDKLLYDPRSYRHKVYLGGNFHDTWKIFPHSLRNPFDDALEAQGISRPLVGNDLVRVAHSELKALLASSLCFEERTPEVYYLNYEGTHDAETFDVNTIWELVKADTVTQGMPFELEDEHIILRHFNSGKLLMVDMVTGKTYLEHVGGFVLDPNGPSRSTLKLKPLQQDEKNLFQVSSYKIKTEARRYNTMFLSHSDYRLSTDSIKKLPTAANISNVCMFTPLEDVHYEQGKVLAKFSSVNNVEEAFSFAKISSQEARDILHLRSGLNQIEIITDIYKTGTKKDLPNEMLVQMETLLKQLIFYLFDQEFDDEDEPNFEELGEPLDRKQLIFRNLNFLEIMIDLIHFPFFNVNFYKIHTVHNTLYAPQVITLAYTCIRYGIMEYRPNELYASQWLDLIIEYSLGDLHDSISANDTLKELIDNNERILETRIKEHTVDKFVGKMMDAGGEKKFTDILRVICICNDQPMLKNQRLVQNAILDQEVRRNFLLLDLKEKDGVLCINGPWTEVEKFIPLVDLRSESLSRDDGKFYEFYCSLIFLFADLCQDRNYLTIRTVRSYFPPDFCIKIICSDDYNYSLRSAFCKLILNLWIDTSPFIQQEIPSLLKKWNQVQDKPQLRVSVANSDLLRQYDDLVNFIFSFLKNADVSVNFEEKGQFLIQLINVVIVMLNIGFLTDKQKFKDLFEHLYSLLQKTDDLFLGENGLKKDELQDGKINFVKLEVSALMISVKKQIFALLKTLIAIEQDFKLQSLIIEFKKFRKNKAESDSRAMQPNHSQTQNLQTGTNGVQNNDSTIAASREGLLASKTTMSVSSISNFMRNSISTKNKKSDFEVLFQKVLASDENNLINRDQAFLEVLMMQSLYNNKTLKALALDLLYSLYQSSASLKDTLRKLQLIQSPEELQLHRNTDNTRKVLFKLAETIELWYYDTDMQEYDQVIILLTRMSSNMLNNKDSTPMADLLQDEDDSEELLRKHPFLRVHLNSCFQRLDPKMQDLCRNTGCSKDLITILRTIYSEEKEFGSQEPKRDEVKFLANLVLGQICFDNQYGNIEVSEFLGSTFLEEVMKDKSDPNIYILINCLLKNSFYLLERQEECEIIVRKLTRKMVSLSSSPYTLAYLLSSLQGLVFHGNTTLTRNQNLVIGRLISTELRPIFQKISSSHFFDSFVSNIKKRFIRFNYRGISVQAVNPDLSLNLAFVEILSCCSFDKNAYAENISQSLIYKEDLTKLLVEEQIDLHPLVLYELVKFVYHVYVETERAYNRSVRHFLMKLMISFKKYLMISIKELQKPETTTHYFLTHKELVNGREVHVDLVNILVESIELFIKEMVKDSVSMGRQDFQKFQDFVVSYYNEIQQLQIDSGINDPFVEARLSSSLKQLQLRIIAANSMNKEQGELRQFMSESMASILQQQMTENPKTPSKKVVAGLISGKFIDNAILQRRNIEERENQLMTIIRRSKVLVEVKKMEKMADSAMFIRLGLIYFKSSCFEDIKEKEFMKFLSIFLVKSNHYFISFLENLVIYIEKNMQHVTNETLSIAMKIFSEFLISNYTDQNPEDNGDTMRRLILRQKFLSSINLIELVIKLFGYLLSKPTMENILDQVFDVAIKLLHGGNIDNQLTFLNVFESLKSQAILGKIHDLLQQKMAVFAKLMIRHNSDKFKTMIDGSLTSNFIRNSDLDFNEVQKFCIKILNFLQQLCEGHNQKLQNYLRTQFKADIPEGGKVMMIHPGQPSLAEELILEEDPGQLRKDYDLVGLSVQLFATYAKYFNNECTDLGVMLLNFMIESIQGPCKGNQERMIDAKVLTSIHEFFNELDPQISNLKEKGFYRQKGKDCGDADRQSLHGLFNLTVRLTLSLLESNLQRSVINEVSQNLNFDVMMHKLHQSYCSFLTRVLKVDPIQAQVKYGNGQDSDEDDDSPFEDNFILPRTLTRMIKTPLFPKEIIESFEIFILLKGINNLNSKFEANIHKLTGTVKEAYNFFDYNSRSIELVFEETLQKVYFVNQPACRYLDKLSKQTLMNDIPRENPLQKLQDFLDQTPHIFDQINLYFNLSRTSYLGIRPDYLEKLRWFALMISGIINFTIIVTYGKKLKNQRSELDAPLVEVWMIWALGVVHLLCASGLLFLHYKIRTKLVYFKAWRRTQKETKKVFLRAVDIEDQGCQEMLVVLDKDPQRLSNREMCKILALMREMDEEGNRSEFVQFSWLLLVYYSIKFTQEDAVLFYFGFYFLCSFLAITLNNQVLYSISLFEVIVSWSNYSF